MVSTFRIPHVASGVIHLFSVRARGPRNSGADGAAPSSGEDQDWRATLRRRRKKPRGYSTNAITGRGGKSLDFAIEGKIRRPFKRHFFKAVLCRRTKANLEPIASAHQHVDWRVRSMQSRIYESACNDSCAARQSFGFDTSFIGPDRNLSSIWNSREIRVRPFRLKRWMMANLTTPRFDGRHLKIVDKNDNMRDAGIDKMGNQFLPLDLERSMERQIAGPAHLELNEITIEFGVNHSSNCFEANTRKWPGDATHKSGKAAGAIPTHLDLASIAIIIAHPKIRI